MQSSINLCLLPITIKMFHLRQVSPYPTTLTNLAVSNMQNLVFKTTGFCLPFLLGRPCEFCVVRSPGQVLPEISGPGPLPIRPQRVFLSQLPQITILVRATEFVRSDS